MTDTNQKLRELRSEYGLRNQDICTLLDMRVHPRTGSNPRLDAWLTLADWGNPMPQQMLDLLILRLKKRKKVSVGI